jgi:iron complex outermembrane receptor protein
MHPPVRPARAYRSIAVFVTGQRACHMLSAGLVSLLAVQPALGQEQMTLEEVVVTALKRQETAQDVSVSIAVVSGEDIRNANVTSAKDLVNKMSGVLAQDHYGTNTFYVIRGIGLNDYRVNSSPSAAVYVDEVYQATMLGGSPGVFDVERVEVLKGPQGTLYGRNASSGAVNIITRKPTDELEGYVKAGYGRFQRVNVEGAVGGPLSDAAAFRVAGMLDRYGESVYRNVSPIPELRDVAAGDAFVPENWAGRAQLLWHAGATQVLLKAAFSNRSGASANTIAIPTQQIPGSTNVCPGTNGPPDNSVRAGCRTGTFNGVSVIPPSGDRTVSHNFAPLFDADASSAALTVQHQLGWANLISITAYDRLEAEQNFDFDSTILDSLNVRQVSRYHAYSQEVRIASEGNERLKWLVGINGGFDDYEEPVRTFYAGDYLGNERGSVNYSGAPGRVAATSPHFATRNTDANSLFQTIDQETTSYAIFTDDEFALSEQFSLVAGYRYTYEKREFAGAGFVGFNDGMSELANQSNLGAALGSGELETKRSTGRLGFNWRPTSAVLAYFTASESFKSGGFDAGFLSNITFITRPYQAEVVRSYELGVKSDPLPNLRLNAAVFHTDFKDPQARLTFFFPGPGGVQVPQGILSNLDAAQILGAEAELMWRPTAGLTLTTTATWLDSEVEENGSGAATFDGRPLSYAPEFSGTFDAVYEFPLSATLTGRMQGNLKYVGSYFLRPEALPIDREDGYTVFDAQLAVGADNWEAILWGRNLGDEQYLVDGQAGFGSNRYSLGMTRTYGLSVTISF